MEWYIGCFSRVERNEVIVYHVLDVKWRMRPLSDRVLKALDFIAIKSADGREVIEVSVAVAKDGPVKTSFEGLIFLLQAKKLPVFCFKVPFEVSEKRVGVVTKGFLDAIQTS